MLHNNYYYLFYQLFFDYRRYWQSIDGAWFLKRYLHDANYEW